MDLERPTEESIRAYDESATICPVLGFGDESMDVSNDPRFFAKNVMDKRLAAFKGLSLVSSLMFATSMKSTFNFKQNMQYSHYPDEWGVGNIAYWEAAAFVLSVIVSTMCLLSLYVIAHQLFYTYRLMTAGPTGFEQASVFYLTRSITVWRHIAIKSLFNGLWLFMVLLGVQLFVAFYKDADGATKGPNEVWVLNMENGSAQNSESAIYKQNLKEIKEKSALNLYTHSILGYIVFATMLGITCILREIRKIHLAVFHENYQYIKAMTDPIQTRSHRMGERAGNAFLEKKKSGR
jgi:hypothetical protein